MCWLVGRKKTWLMLMDDDDENDVGDDVDDDDDDDDDNEYVLLVYFRQECRQPFFWCVCCFVACTSKERQSFNTELVKVFKEEYERMLSARGPEAVSKYNSFAKNHFRCLSGKEAQAPVVAYMSKTFHHLVYSAYSRLV